MKYTIAAVALLLPALALSQEAPRYTNADLNIPPKKDAYTNADLRRLPPLPVQSAPAVATAPLPAPPRDLAGELRTQRLAGLSLQRDMIEVEMGYWQGILKSAHSGVGDINAYPRIGSDTAEARERLAALKRTLYLVNEEMVRLP
jgi:hypothetical protein